MAIGDASVARKHHTTDWGYAKRHGQGRQTSDKPRVSTHGTHYRHNTASIRGMMHGSCKRQCVDCGQSWCVP